jgi:Methylamine utilisation protein MauE
VSSPVGTILLAVAGLLLLGAGAAKVVEPRRTVGALRALGWPSSPRLVRAGAVAEALLGAAALVVGGPVVGVLVAASYVGFAVFVAAALRSGTPIGSCGCFGEADTPPRLGHVGTNLALAAGGLAALGDAVPIVEEPWLVVPAIALAYATFDILARRPRWTGRARQGAPHDRV